jgi:hypothetical protein
LVEEVDNKQAQDWNKPQERQLKKLLRAGERFPEDDTYRNQEVQQYHYQAADHYRAPFCWHLALASCRTESSGSRFAAPHAQRSELKASDINALLGRIATPCADGPNGPNCQPSCSYW